MDERRREFNEAVLRGLTNASAKERRQETVRVLRDQGKEVTPEEVSDHIRRRMAGFRTKMARKGWIVRQECPDELIMQLLQLRTTEPENEQDALALIDLIFETRPT